MASSKVMASSKPRNSDLSSTTSSRSRRASTSASNTTTKPPHQSTDQSFQTESTMTVDGILRTAYASPSTESTLLDAQITLIETPNSLPPQIETNDEDNHDMPDVIPQDGRSADDIWREIVVGRKEMKEEPDEMMTLEDFLAKAGAVDVVGEEGDDVKMPPERLSGGLFAFDPVPPTAFQVLDKVEGSIVGFGNGVEVDLVAGGGSGSGNGGGRGKRGRAVVMEPVDKAAQQRQRRMIKNRESAARSRERKQAYQVELESLAVRLDQENEQLLKEKEERTTERFKQLMEKVVPIVEKRRPRRALRRVNSLQW